MSKLKNFGRFFVANGPKKSIAKIKGRYMPVAMREDRNFIFVSNELNQTGAPFVLLDIVSEYVSKFGAKTVQVMYPSIDETNEKVLTSLGVKEKLYTPHEDFDLLSSELKLRPDDFVLLNTMAVGANVRDYFFQALEDGRLDCLHWYIHEDDPGIFFLDKQYLNRVKRLAKTGKLLLICLAERSQQNFSSYLGVKAYKLPYRFRLEAKSLPKPSGPDFSRLDFVLNGTSDDGRKGQFNIVAAFSKLICNHIEASPELYREFKLSLVGVGNGWVSKNLKNSAKLLLGDRVEIVGRLERAEALAYMAKHNVSICYSYMEALPLSIMEGMAMGHVVLRNDCSGMEEQLRPGENGLFLKTDDLEQVVSILEKLLNKKNYSDSDLAKMGQTSRDIVSGYEDVSYIESFDAVGR